MRAALIAKWNEPTGAVLQEVWLPQTKSRADLVRVHANGLCAFEIKSAADSLNRLARQAEGYEAVFTACTAVVAIKHLERVRDVLPPWWGLITTTRDELGLRSVRRARQHERLDAGVLVRMLWRDETEALLLRLEVATPPRATRRHLWDQLLARVDAQQLQKLVAAALAARDPAAARIGTRWSESGLAQLG